MANRLAHESSLYLRQHKDNPVDWFPWGQEAFNEAARRDVPLLVSVGYSACHWCHVMAHESFEDEYLAGLMNRHFVCVKVDREERPDVDAVLMQAVQMISGHGGWPLNVFCLPDGRPFFGGTYFPAEDRGQGIVPWPQLLMRVAEHWKRERDSLVENADNIRKNMETTRLPRDLAGEKEADALRDEELLEAARGLCAQYDDEWGGFGQAPKFPPSMALDFLMTALQSRAAEAEPRLARSMQQAVRGTLQAMARGGLFDQIGGGFARYSVDRYWRIPHFEKMLYDNALLLDAYAKGFALTGDPLYQAVCEESFDWLEREMSAPGGGFFASLDADSEGVEGKFYVWTPYEVKDILGQEKGEAFCAAYGITAEGNFEEGRSNPTLADADFTTRDSFAAERQKLLDAREKRVRPGRDEKVILAWNALTVRGLATMAFYLGREDVYARAARAADFLWENLRAGGPEDAPRFHSVWYGADTEGGQSGARFDGNLDDYAFFAEALLALASVATWAEPGRAEALRQRAGALLETLWRHFRDADEPGCFFTADDADSNLPRRKDWFDNALPAGNSAWVRVLADSYALTGQARWAEELQRLRGAYAGIAGRVPNGLGHVLAAWTDYALGVAVVKLSPDTPVEPLRGALAKRAPRHLNLVTTGEVPRGYQLCVGTECLPLAEAPEAVAEQIAGTLKNG